MTDFPGLAPFNRTVVLLGGKRSISGGRIGVRPALYMTALSASRDKGSNPRFVLASLEGDPQILYDDTYCALGEMEYRIKEQQLGLFADPTSCHAWWANQFRLLLSSCAYILLEAIRRIALAGTELARAQVCTIRLKLLKIDTVFLRNTRRIRLLFSSAYPLKNRYCSTLLRLSSA